MTKATPQGGYALALALIMGVASGCATSSKVVGDEGAPCTADDACAEGLRCKASACTPEKSRVGQVCVTDKGCADGLHCLGGRCSLGAAEGGEVAAACGHLGGLVSAASQAAMVGQGEASNPELLALELKVFVAECEARLMKTGTTKEKAACIRQAATIEAVQACP